MHGALFVLTLIAALGAATVSGVLYAFSTFVMKALTQVPPAEGIRVMQRINLTVLGPGFMLAFMGTALLSVALIVVALTRLDEPGSVQALIGGILYLVGPIGFTFFYHQPRNLALNRIDADAPDSARYWTDYVRAWVPPNHVRVAIGIAGTVLLILALVAD